jgi:hypothetical protein
MKSSIVSGIVLLVTMCQPLEAQDIRKVIDVVGQLEDSLRAKIKNETKERSGDVAALRAEVTELRRLLELAREDQAHRTKDTVVLQPAARPAVPAAAAPEGFPAIKVGTLAQVQTLGAEEQTTSAQDADPNYHSHWQRQLYVRRLRVLVGGNISRATSLFFESDAPNIGKVSANGAKLSGVSMYVQDAYVQHTFCPELSVVAGLQLVGITRNSLQSAASLMAMNYGTYSFMQNGPLDNSVGRDVGFNARGFLLDERLEYRVGGFSGKNLNVYSPLRYTVRLNYDFLDREKGFFYTGTTLGKGQLLALGGGLDLQGSYAGYAVDAMADLPFPGPGSVTVSASFSHLDGGGTDADSTFFTGQIPRQNLLFAEAGYLLGAWGLQPYLKYEAQIVDARVRKQVGATSPELLSLQNKLRTGHRYGGGVNFYLNGHGATFKLLYEHVVRNRLTLDKKNWESAGSNELSFQVQYYVY